MPDKDPINMRETQYLSLVAIAPNDSNALIELTRLASQHNCLIMQCHVNQQGDSYLLNILFSGTWSSIAKIEAGLNTFQKKTKTQLIQQRLTITNTNKPAIPYTLYILMQDEARLLNQILRYLKQDGLYIQEIFVESYKARFTQISMQSLTIRIQLNSALSIGEWRDQFMLFCDEINVDAVMEPEKW